MTEHTGVKTEHTGVIAEHTGVMTEHTGVTTEHTGATTTPDENKKNIFFFFAFLFSKKLIIQDPLRCHRYCRLQARP